MIGLQRISVEFRQHRKTIFPESQKLVTSVLTAASGGSLDCVTGRQSPETALTSAGPAHVVPSSNVDQKNSHGRGPFVLPDCRLTVSGSKRGDLIEEFLFLVDSSQVELASLPARPTGSNRLRISGAGARRAVVGRTDRKQSEKTRRPTEASELLRAATAGP